MAGSNSNADERVVDSMNASCSTSPCPSSSNHWNDKIPDKRKKTSVSCLEQEDDDDDNEDDGESNLFGFMFGNVDDFGSVEADYLDEDAKEHLKALASKIGPAIPEFQASFYEQEASHDGSERDVGFKAENAIDFEDCEDLYEGPEIEDGSSEDKFTKDESFIDRAVLTDPLKHAISIVDEDNYDEDIEENPNEANLIQLETEVPMSEKDNHQNDESKKEIASTSFSPDKGDEKDNGFSLLGGEDGQIVSADFSQENANDTDNILPVLYKEDGKVVLRFSEIFGAQVFQRTVERRSFQRISFAKRKPVFIEKDDSFEEDEECFMQTRNDSYADLMFQDYNESNKDMARANHAEWQDVSSLNSEGNDWEGKKDSYVSSEAMNYDVDSIVKQMDFSAAPFLYPIDQQEWVDNIVWDTSSIDSCPNTVAEKNVLLEPFSQVPCAENRSQLSMRTCHPQMLRLESCQAVASDKPKGLEYALKDHILNCLKKLSLQNNELLEDSWTGKIVWDDCHDIPNEKIIYNLQDDQMVFEVMDTKDGPRSRLNTGVMLINPSVKANKGESGEHSSQLTLASQFNISNDKYYSNRKLSQQQKANTKKRGQHGTKVLHSLPAMRLQTMKPKLNNKDLANFHRPKALWYPRDNEIVTQEQGRLLSQGPMKAIIMSLGGKGSKLYVDAAEKLESVRAKAAKKLDFKPSEKVKFIYSSNELQDGKSLSEQQVRPNSVLHVIRTKVHPLPKAQRVPNENKPRRPPGAFKKKSELSLKDGHVFLMEYCEERPLLLGNAGMGARLLTYYQKINSADQNASSLQNATNCVGTVVSLEPTEKSPFLGDIKPGYSQCSIETNMFRAPVYQHKVSHTDFLLVRSAKGKISLRRVDHLYVVGQQEPHMEVMTPGSKTVQNYLSNRLLVYVYREFRATEKSGNPPYVRADELSTYFPTYTESFLRKRLKHCAELQKGAKGEMLWVMKRGFRLPSEEELRSLVTPENVCAYESMQAGLHHLKRVGIRKLTGVSGVSSAMTQLPDEAISLAAASHIEKELQITSWNLSCSFVASTLQGRECIERMEIKGVGDPSGRGLGFSYLRVPPKPTASSALVKKKAAAARGNSAVTGTDADLRRLSMDAAREVLLKFNVSEDEIEKMGRWDRIAMVRRLSSEQAAAGIKVDATVSTKFARGQRMSFLQLQQQAREKCQEIWDRQFQSLSAADAEINEGDSDENSDLDSYIGDLENLLDAEDDDDANDIDSSAKRDKRENKGTISRKRQTQAQAEEEMEDEAMQAKELQRILRDDDEPLMKTKKIGGKPTERMEQGDLELHKQSMPSKDYVNKKTKKVYKRIVRTTKPDGTITEKEVPITDPKEVAKYLSKKKSSALKDLKQNGNGITPQALAGKDTDEMFKDGKVLKSKKGKDKPVRDKFICGACGQSGHMRTNKKCPMYKEDTDTVLEKPEVDHMKKVSSSAENLQANAGSKNKVKKKISKVVKQTEGTDNENAKTGIEDGRLSGKLLPVKFVCGTGNNKTTDEANADGLAIEHARNAEWNDNINKPSFSAMKVKIPKKNKKFEDSDGACQRIYPYPGEQISVQSLVDKPEMYKEHRPTKIKIKKPKGISINEQRRQEVSLEPENMDIYEEEQRALDEAKLRSMQMAMERQKEKRLREEKERKRLREEREREERRLREEQERELEERRREEEEEEMRREELLRQEEEERQHRLMLERMQYEAVAKREEEKRRSKHKLRAQVERRVEWEDAEQYEKPSRHRRHNRYDRVDGRGTKRYSSSEFGRSSQDHGPPKRRRGGEALLSNILETIVEKMKNRTDISYLFLKPVTKKEAPDYFQYVDKPMDLSTIKQRVKRFDYKSRDEFQADVLQIVYNAHIYNEDRNPGIPPLADQLLDFCNLLLDEYDSDLTEAEAMIGSI